jgi:hypothetical protein
MRFLAEQAALEIYWPKAITEYIHTGAVTYMRQLEGQLIVDTPSQCLRCDISGANRCGWSMAVEN